MSGKSSKTRSKPVKISLASEISVKTRSKARKIIKMRENLAKTRSESIWFIYI